MAKRKSKSKQKVSGSKPDDISDQFEAAFLAGLGALDNARKAGTKTFESLVQQGEAYRRKTTNRTEAMIDEVQSTIRDLAGDAQSKATGLLEQVRGTSQIDKLGRVFDSRVDDAMQRLGMPRKKDLDALNSKLDRILAKIDSQKSAAAKKKTAKKKTAKKKATRKRKPAKKAAAKSRRKTAKRTASKPAARKARKTSAKKG